MIETIYPSADGTHLDWTPLTAGPHYKMVNEALADSDTSYVSTIPPGNTDTYVAGPLSVLTGKVFGLATNLSARKDDAAARQIASVIRSGGVDYVGVPTVGLTTSYLFYRQLYQNNPSGSAWTIPSVNASEFGVQEIT